MVFSASLYSQEEGSPTQRTSSNSNEVTLNFACTTLEILPQDSDFPSSIHRGKVLISTRSGDYSYYTNYQTWDGQVNIKLKYQPNTEIYFKIIDPDDESPYETNTQGNDNIGGLGTLTINGITGTSISANTNNNGEINGYLTITNQYSGDNYKVLASTDSTFPNDSRTVETTNLIAWKRMYIEPHNSYQSGSFLSFNYNNGDTYLRVWDRGDLNPGDQIIIFDKYGNQTITTINSINSSTSTSFLYINNLGRSYPKYSGVRKLSDTRIYSFQYDHGILQNAFGKNGNGVDSNGNGGVFVDYQLLSGNFKTIPNFYWKVSGLTDDHNFNLLKYWFENQCTGCNIFMIAALGNGGHIQTPTGFSIEYGKTDRNNNLTSIYIYNIGQSFFTPQLENIAANEYCVHELGHQLDIGHNDFPHIHQNVNHPDHTGIETCIMTYYPDKGTGHSEYDIQCINKIRRAKDRL